MHVPDIIIAIDGYSSTGKSTFAKKIAAELSFLYLDSGALYRGVTLYAIENGIISMSGEIDMEALDAALPEIDIHFEDNGEGSRTYMGGRCIEREIRTLPVSGKVSPISAVPAVRKYVDERLREFGRKKRVVMDGRDIGTTVFPEAELKIFMTADPGIRAQRRLDELKAKGEEATLEDVLSNLKERDYIDSHREASPLSKADDAIVLDNSHMNMDEQMKWVKDIIKERFEVA
ncbi:MAG: (d)CMP kinase [Clostridium sp.]|nr:(d)CMP kinase [Bacteroides sp.]MCM1198719.1 (d)CMP kinase [Clostridium sp.]